MPRQQSSSHMHQPSHKQFFIRSALNQNHRHAVTVSFLIRMQTFITSSQACTHNTYMPSHTAERHGTRQSCHTTSLTKYRDQWNLPSPADCFLLLQSCAQLFVHKSTPPTVSQISWMLFLTCVFVQQFCPVGFAHRFLMQQLRREFSIENTPRRAIEEVYWDTVSWSNLSLR